MLASKLSFSRSRFEEGRDVGGEEDVDLGFFKEGADGLPLDLDRGGGGFSCEDAELKAELMCSSV